MFQFGNLELRKVAAVEDFAQFPGESAPTLLLANPIASERRKCTKVRVAPRFQKTISEVKKLVISEFIILTRV